MYCRHYWREIFGQCSNVFISKPKKVFWRVFTFSQSTQNFEDLEKKYQFHRLNVLEVIDSYKRGY